MTETRIELDNGKYTVMHCNGANLVALRYGNTWRDLAGDGLILALCQRIEELEAEVEEAYERGYQTGIHS